MNFASKELSERLDKLGCVSVSPMVYYQHETEGLCLMTGTPLDGCRLLSAFCLEDFLGSHPEAVENCKRVWGDAIRLICPTCENESEGPNYDYERRMILNVTDPWACLESTMVKNGKA